MDSFLLNFKSINDDFSAHHKISHSMPLKFALRKILVSLYNIKINYYVIEEIYLSR